jgi:hypothetical protein
MKASLYFPCPRHKIIVVLSSSPKQLDGLEIRAVGWHLSPCVLRFTPEEEETIERAHELTAEMSFIFPTLYYRTSYHNRLGNYNHCEK